jgi:hypothetical protein
MDTEVRGTYDGWIGHDVYDSEGHKIGEITDLYYDDVTQKPEWLEVKTGFVGGKRFIPIQGATRYAGGDDAHDDDLQVAYREDFIKSAPKISSEGEHLSPAEEQELWSYYEFDLDDRTKTRGYGYGKTYGKLRPDADYTSAPYDRAKEAWDPPGGQTTAAVEEEVIESHNVQTTTQVEVPVETELRLRRYQTVRPGTRMVEVPITETDEHVEVAGVESKATGATVRGGGRVEQDADTTRRTK